METLDLVRIDADGSPHWFPRLGLTPEENPASRPGWNGGWPLTGTRIVGRPRELVRFWRDDNITR